MGLYSGKGHSIQAEAEALRIWYPLSTTLTVKHLPLAEFVHNHRKHDSRNALPFYLMIGYNPRSLPHTLASSLVPAVEEHVCLLQKAQEEAIACHNIAMQRMAKQSHRVKYTPWKIGDKVWLSAKNLIIPIPKKKLGPKRYGPFPIKAVLSLITFMLQLPEQWQIHPMFHTLELQWLKKVSQCLWLFM